MLGRSLSCSTLVVCRRVVNRRRRVVGRRRVVILRLHCSPLVRLKIFEKVEVGPPGHLILHPPPPEVLSENVPSVSSGSDVSVMWFWC